MPAVTVDNILALERVSRPAPDGVVRPVLTVTTAPSGFEGEGFPVHRAFAGIPYQYTDPFIMMDQMGEVEWRSRARLRARSSTPIAGSRRSLI